MSSLQEGQTKSAQDIQSLKNTEQALYKQLEAAVAANSSSATQEQIMNQITKVNALRMTQLKSLGTMSDSLKKNISGTLTTYTAEMSDSVNVIEDEMKKSKERLNKINELKNNKLRMAEINTYYGKQYKDNANTIKIILYTCIPIILLIILQKKELVPAILINALIVIILAIGSIIVIKRVVVNTFLRDNMNYDELKSLNVPNAGPSVYQYDMNEYNKLNPASAVSALVDDSSYLASNLGFSCVGAACCSIGTTFDATQHKCISGAGATGAGAGAGATGAGAGAGASATGASATGASATLGNALGNATSSLGGALTGAASSAESSISSAFASIEPFQTYNNLSYSSFSS
jgi:hypothetical protein